MMLTLDVGDIGMTREERLKGRHHPQKSLGVRAGLLPRGPLWALVLDSADELASVRGPRGQFQAVQALRIGTKGPVGAQATGKAD